MAKPLDRSRDIYWLQKLSPFRHGNRMLPSFIRSDHVGQQSVLRRISGVRRSGLAMDVLCLSAFSLVLRRYNGGEDLLIGCYSSGRDEPAFVRCEIHSDCNSTTFMQNVGAELREAHENWPCQFPDGDAGKDILQIGFAFNGKEPPHSSSESVPLLLNVLESDEGLELRLRFDAARHSPYVMQQMSGHVARAIEFLASNTSGRIRDFDLLSSDERQVIAHTFNANTVKYACSETLHGLVESQAGRSPKKTAVIYKETELTYKDLDDQANRLASQLRSSFGVTVGDIVGVMTRRSEKMVVGLLGTMKAGAAYVPINPRHPWETVQYMLQNAGVKVLIIDSESISAASIFDGQLFVLDIELDDLPAVSANLNPCVPETSLAYVIYTSGSTGRPKGVAVEHRSIVNTILWRNDYYHIGSNDVNLQMPSFAFDSSVIDIFCVLSAGGTLLIPEEELRLDARYLKNLAAKQGMTSFIATPSYYRILIGELRDAAPDLRAVTLAGESITPDIVRTHAAHLPNVTLFNEYGPTENAVCSTACILRPDDPTVPIGKPISNVRIFLLDDHLRLCPIGVPGEICLGGPGLARGYLNQAELTAERFIPSPIPDCYNGTLYKSGDRGYWRPDGMLEFIGRVDNQVKIRGFRIELDEVEGALLKHPCLDEAAVICKQDASGSRYLAAYAKPGSQVTPSELREHVRNLLPHYMVPDVFILMPKLPLNLNGKIDRSLLRTLDDFETHASGQRASMSPLEASLLAIASDILSRSQMTLDDNFFELGGNSLKVMEFISRIRSKLLHEVELRDIYTCPTARDLANQLHERLAAGK